MDQDSGLRVEGLGFRFRRCYSLWQAKGVEHAPARVWRVGATVTLAGSEEGP